MNIIKHKTLNIIALASIVLLSNCKKDDNTDAVTTPSPIVSSVSPKADEQNVAHNKILSVSFDQMMKANSFDNSTFILKDGNTDISGIIEYSGYTATFEPTIPLTQNTTYTATVSKNVKSTSGKGLASDYSWKFTTGTSATGLSSVALGTSENFVILAKTAINNNPISSITGDIAVSPAATTYITGFSLTDHTGFATSAQVTGNVYAADMATPTPVNLTTAVNDMVTAYNDASGRLFPDYLEYASGSIGGKTLTSGLYKWTNTVSITSDVYISGSSSDIWIFQIDGNLSISTGSKIILSGGAKPENIFWQVAGEATLGTNSDFKGIIISMTGITFRTGATFKGRALAQTAVIMDANIITQP